MRQAAITSRKLQHRQGSSTASVQRQFDKTLQHVLLVLLGQPRSLTPLCLSAKLCSELPGGLRTVEIRALQGSLEVLLDR